MKKARAMYIPAGGKKAVWGPVDQSVLPEGYPYKEVTVTKEPVDLSLSEYWLDEIPREDRVRFSPGMQVYTYCKISDGTLSNDDVRKLSITMTWDGELKTINYSDLPDDAFIIEDDYVVVNSGLYPTTIIVRKPNALVRVSTWYDDLVLFNKVGFYIDENLRGPASIKTVEPVFTFTTETIHTMAPEFLPAGVGGNDREFIVELTQDYHGQFSGNKTYEEMLAAAQAGKHLVAYMTTPDGYVWKSVGCQVANDGDATIIAFLILGASLNMPLTIGCAPDNVWAQMG